MLSINRRLAQWAISSTILSALLALGLASCGGSSNSSGGSGGGGGTAPTGSTVTVSFSGYAVYPGSTPTAVAEQIGTGSWASATLQGGQLSLAIPEGTTAYSIAYACSVGSSNEETIIQATVQDSTSYSTPGCYSVNGQTTASASGTVDATAIPGAATVGIYGAQGFGVTNIGGIVGSFNAMLPTGTNDIAAVVYDTSFNVIAVKIVRSQTVPLSGLSIVFAPTDASSQEFATITGSPAGFTVSPSVIAQFITGNGTSFVVSSTNLPNTAMP